MLPAFSSRKYKWDNREISNLPLSCWEFNGINRWHNWHPGSFTILYSPPIRHVNGAQIEYFHYQSGYFLCSLSSEDLQYINSEYVTLPPMVKNCGHKRSRKWFISVWSYPLKCSVVRYTCGQVLKYSTLSICGRGGMYGTSWPWSHDFKGIHWGEGRGATDLGTRVLIISHNCNTSLSSIMSYSCNQKKKSSLRLWHCINTHHLYRTAAAILLLYPLCNHESKDQQRTIKSTETRYSPRPLMSPNFLPTASA